MGNLMKPEFKSVKNLDSTSRLSSLSTLKWFIPIKNCNFLLRCGWTVLSFIINNSYPKTICDQKNRQSFFQFDRSHSAEMAGVPDAEMELHDLVPLSVIYVKTEEESVEQRDEMLEDRHAGGFACI